MFRISLTSTPRVLLAALFLLSSHFLLAQTTASGTVTDTDGLPLIGASVLVRGTTAGTVTDVDGNFSLSVPEGNDALIVSYLGYQSRTITLGADAGAMRIELSSDDSLLDEVVVVGYGTVQKSDVVGSVTSVDVDEATAIPTTNVAEMLRGRAPGVQVNLADARPGGSSNIVIRGKVSLVGNDPLIIVDGVPYDNINDVAPDDITSIEILKDASSQAIYGARAANGVILITTKRGQAGGIRVNYHGYTTVQTLTRNFDLYTAEEFAQLRREAQRTDSPDGLTYLPDAEIFEPFELEALQNGEFVDWEDLILENAAIHSHSLSLSGGSENTRLFTSLNYFDQDGVIPTSGFRRGAVRVNVDQRVNDRISLQANVNFQKSDQTVESTSLNFITISPLARPFDAAGNLIREPLGENNLTVNPLWNIREADNDRETTLTDLNLVGQINLLPGLDYKLNTFFRNRYFDQGIYRSTQHVEGDGDVQGLATLSNGLYREFLVENIINYVPQLGEANKLDFTFVQATNQRNSEFTSQTKSGFPNDALSYNGNATVLLGSARDVTRRRLVSFLGRARYNLADRYLFTFTMRADGSSVFAADNKWGYFPAGAFAWKLHQEDFLVNNRAITELKLRLSYGATGNEGINPSESLGVADDLPYVFGGVTAGGFAPLNRLPNPNLKWETTTTANVAVDFGLWNNRLRGTAEVYRANTTDFLLDRLLPGTSGFSVTRFNIGEVQNEGIELALNYDVIRNDNFKWNIGAIFSSNRNEIISLDGQTDEEGNPVDFVSQGLFVGEPIDNVRARIVDGIWQEGDDIENSAQPDDMPGDIRIRDINGDTAITDLDLVTFKENPDWYGSLNTTVSFKGFELFADLYFVRGGQRRNPWLASFENGATLQGIRNGIAVPYYTPENPSNQYPRPRPSTPSYLFDLAVQDASYLRLRTLTLAYSFPAPTIKKLGLTNLRLYATGTNLFTDTDYLSWSPEINAGDFPDARGFTFGLKVGL